ncbi:hypothetical protein [Halosolutus gelatinilyticus]|uniref:hypothetical protein n=1 Tax=Halosolutus gelatinilyticus TaxID=2931975 RepID=UPI001FF221BE|nr:hypothetical protein [Halosolutus gelatinilyticus]
MTIALPESLAETWRPVGTRTSTTTVLLASITAETTLYEPVETGPAVAELGASEVPVRSLFAVDLSFSPPLRSIGISPAGALSTAAPKARRQLVEVLVDDGIAVDGTRTERAFEAESGAEGRWYVLDVSYPLAPAVAANGPDRIAAETHVAVWPTDAAYGLAGGTVPLGLPDAVASSLSTVPPIDPDRDREAIAALVRSLDFGDDDGS